MTVSHLINSVKSNVVYLLLIFLALTYLDLDGHIGSDQKWKNYTVSLGLFELTSEVGWPVGLVVLLFRINFAVCWWRRRAERIPAMVNTGGQKFHHLMTEIWAVFQSLKS